MSLGVVVDLQRQCLNPAAMVLRRQWFRGLASPFLHGDDWHLYYNMASLLWKGVQIEPHMGPLSFGIMVAFLTVVSQALYIAVGWLALTGAGYSGIWSSCAVGFSGVLFGLKAILNAHSPTETVVWGWRLPTKYAAWAELLLIQMVTPHASFTGHLCGILAGLLYLVVEPTLRQVLIESGIGGDALRGGAAADIPQGGGAPGPARGLGMGMGGGMGGAFHPVWGGGMGRLRHGLRGGGGLFGPFMGGLFGGGGMGGARPPPAPVQHQGPAGPGAWRGSHAGQAGTGTAGEGGGSSPASYAAQREARRRAGGQAFKERRAASQSVPLSDAELAAQLQAEEDAAAGLG